MISKTMAQSGTGIPSCLYGLIWVFLAISEIIFLFSMLTFLFSMLTFTLFGFVGQYK